MSKQVRAYQWYQESHAKIHDTAQAVDTGKPAEAAKPFHENADTMSADVTNTGSDAHSGDYSCDDKLSPSCRAVFNRDPRDCLEFEK